MTFKSSFDGCGDVGAKIDDSVGFRIVTITKNGDISTYSPELAGIRAFRLGNVRFNSFSEVLCGPEYALQQIDVEAGNDLCAATCAYHRLCGGGYVSNKYFEHGTVRSAETVTCRLHRQSVIEVLIGELEAEAVEGENPQAVASITSYKNQDQLHCGARWSGPSHLLS